MAQVEMICHCNQVDYVMIRKAMIAGARTLQDIQEMTGAATSCRGCESRVLEILASGCSCNNIALADIVEAVSNGADTVEAVGKQTKAGTTCGRCQALINNVIENKK